MNVFFLGFRAENCLLSFFLPDVMHSHCGMLLLFSCSSLLPISECEQVLFAMEAAERCIQQHYSTICSSLEYFVQHGCSCLKSVSSSVTLHLGSDVMNTDWGAVLDTLIKSSLHILTNGQAKKAIILILIILIVTQFSSPPSSANIFFSLEARSEANFSYARGRKHQVPATCSNRFFFSPRDND